MLGFVLYMFSEYVQKSMLMISNSVAALKTETHGPGFFDVKTV